MAFDIVQDCLGDKPATVAFGCQPIQDFDRGIRQHDVDAFAHRGKVQVNDKLCLYNTHKVCVGQTALSELQDYAENRLSVRVLRGVVDNQLSESAQPSDRPCNILVVLKVFAVK